MSYAALYKGTVPIIQLALGDGGNDDPVWTRPAWPLLADLTPTDNTFKGVYGVDSTDSNFVSLLVTTDAGTYTVDWGDGTTPDSGIASNVQANHTYDYTSITASVVGQFKPVVVTVTSQDGNITTFDLQRKNPLNIPTAASAINWLDIAINASAMTSLIIGKATTIVKLTDLQQVKIYNHSITNMTSMFQGCSGLQSIPLFNTSSVTNMTSMFQNCSSLRSVPLFDTSAVTNMTSTFSGCSSLTSVPLFNTAAVNTTFTMFSGCSSLRSVPLFVTSAVTTMSGMFQNCSSLRGVPLFDTASVTGMGSMFSGCSSLRNVPSFVTSAVNNMFNMFSGCSSLRSVPLFVTTSVATMQTMFQNCSSLKSVPSFVTNSVTNMLSMFNGCSSLKSVPLFNTSAVTSIRTMFQNCSSLSVIPTFNTAAIPTSTGSLSTFSGCSSLCQGRIDGLRFSISYANCKLSTAALNDIFTGLGTANSGSVTITVTGNPGAATCNTSIAIAKGWNVTI